VHDSDCDRVFALLSEYLDHELAPATCEELDGHLSGCPECVEFVRSLKRSMQLCRQLGNCLPAPPALDRQALAGFRRAYEEMLARRRSPK
jgi:RNA polymerase sigma-70 factor (ECF subfamily)